MLPTQPTQLLLADELPGDAAAQVRGECVSTAGRLQRPVPRRKRASEHTVSDSGKERFCLVSANNCENWYIDYRVEDGVKEENWCQLLAAPAACMCWCGFTGG